MEQFDAIVLAGGSIGGEYSAAAGTSIKAMVPVGDSTVMARVLRALEASGRIAAMCIVGPPEVSCLATDPIGFVSAPGSAPRNVLAGLDLCTSSASRVLICASDTPLITGAAICNLLDRAPLEAEQANPVVFGDDFTGAYPGAPATYVSLAGTPPTGGPVTIGSQLIVTKDIIRRNISLFDTLFSRRKSQFGLAQILGPAFVLKLMARQLTITDIEVRASSLTGCHCCAVPGCSPDLAFDIDKLEEWQDALTRI